MKEEIIVILNNGLSARSSMVLYISWWGHNNMFS